MSEDKKIPLGPVGENVRRNVERLRTLHGWTYRQLSELLAQHGRPIPPLGLSRIEKAERRVDADDLVALAVVFGVNPNALLLPSRLTAGQIKVTGHGPADVWRVWAWVEGRLPLVVPDDDDGTALVEFQTRARPKGLRDFSATVADEIDRYHSPFKPFMRKDDDDGRR